MKTFEQCPCRRPACEWNAESQECSSSCVCRIVDEDLIEKTVELWHQYPKFYDVINLPLHEWLGWSKYEYDLWCQGFNPPGHEPSAEEQRIKVRIKRWDRVGDSCDTCEKSYEWCTQRILSKHSACCSACYYRDTHNERTKK